MSWDREDGQQVDKTYASEEFSLLDQEGLDYDPLTRELSL